MNFRRLKYEQIMNSTKIYWKTAEVRIFWQIPAEMSLESQCLCGFLEGTVEIRLARLGHWHHYSEAYEFHDVIRRNKISPFRALTPSIVIGIKNPPDICRNKISPFRALTHGLIRVLNQNQRWAVEIRLARLGHWHNQFFFHGSSFLL